MKIRILLLSSLILLPLELLAQSPEEKGLAIAVEADKRDTGWNDIKTELSMVLRNRQGQESKRRMRSKILEVEGDGDKSLIVFDYPRDIKNTAFLSYTHALKADDQWLYLPALKRVKRISSNNKSGPFMGSEFAYEDISSQEVEKYKYKFIKDDQINGRDAFVVERYPQYKHSGYTRQIAWVDKEMYQPLKIIFYDRKDSLLKELIFVDYKQYLGKFWRPLRLEMVNQQNGKSTTLEYKDYQFQTGLTDADFNRNSLKRTR